MPASGTSSQSIWLQASLLEFIDTTNVIPGLISTVGEEMESSMPRGWYYSRVPSTLDHCRVVHALEPR
ncbi:hypothetical protein PISMIDRAFT_671287 [Pisolithus microcarpus 441]|uniref:Uncharacterized protein n=1 Tax=Pisolithus microcarpus 441 TaxID=765257 RepID=A0A0C9ZVU8_9AGAM|nr:hypothetical protein PISMIDRAFT_671287 [Pisolithus microcarpus 441]